MRRIVAGLALVGLGLAMGGAVGEVVARLLSRPPTLVPAVAPANAGLRELTTVFELATPGIEGIHKGAYYRTNSMGFRGPEYPPRAPEGTTRIIAIGDSFVMGEGVAEEDAYVGQLQRLLNHDGSDRKYEVLNLGISGANIFHAIDRFEVIGLALHPDLIVYGLTSNDIEIDGYRTTIDGGTIQEQRVRNARFDDSPSYLLRLLWPRWVSFRTGMNPPRGTYMFEVLDNYLHNPRVWSKFVESFDRLAEIQARIDVPVVVFVHPILAYLLAFHPFLEVYDKVGNAAEARGLRVVQGYPVLAGRQAEALWISPANPHPNVEAHRLFAESLYDGLRASALLDSEAK